MLDALKSLFENNVLSEEVRSELEEAWNKKVKENRLAVTAELREEFAQKYEHDKKTMVESIDKMLSERLAEEIAEFKEDRKQLAEAKAKYAVAQRKNANLLKNFVSETLAKEIKELHADQKSTADKFVALEDFVVEALSKEIAEFYEDKKDLAETKVRLVKEARQNFDRVQKDFIKKSSAIVSETVSTNLNKEISSLKEDIEEARRNDFGRKIFEAFSNEYTQSYLNEKSETAKLMKVVESKDQQLIQAKQAASKAINLAESKTNEIKKINESMKRKETINELTAPLSREQSEIMKDLLESVQTNRLRSAFDKYLPSVMNGNSPERQKAVLAEGTEITGNRQQTNDNKNANDGNVVELRRLAGLS